MIRNHCAPLYLSLLLFFFMACSQGQSTEQNESPPASTVADTTPSDTLDESEVTSELDSDAALYQGRKNAITKAVQQVSPAVVSITSTEVVQANRQQEMLRRLFNMPTEEYTNMGSGFIISSDGLVVTNEHVADANAKKIMVSMMDSSQYEAEIVGTDELADLALLRIKADRTFPTVEFGDSDEVMVGEWALAIGNPFGLFESAQPSVTVGVVSALHRDFRPNPTKPRVYIDMIQTDAAINSGNSGGPLVDSRGRVIGVNTFIFTGGTSAGFVGLGFAIPSNRVQKIINQLAATGEVKTEYDLGMETTPMTPRLVRQNNLPYVMGLFVNSINRDGPAYQGGIRPGDVIVRIGDERVQSQMHAQALFREYAVGDMLHMQLIRNNKLYEAKIKLRSKVSER